METNTDTTTETTNREDRKADRRATRRNNYNPIFLMRTNANNYAMLAIRSRHKEEYKELYRAYLTNRGYARSTDKEQSVINKRLRHEAINYATKFLRSKHYAEFREIYESYLKDKGVTNFYGRMNEIEDEREKINHE